MTSRNFVVSNILENLPLPLMDCVPIDKKIGIGENYWLFFKKSRLDNSSNFSRFLTRNYIVFLDSHEELKTEKNDMPNAYL